MSELYLRCPIIFRGHLKGPEQTLMYFGFECDSGWFELIFELSINLETLALKLIETGVKPDKLPKVSQVKEKFGTLRYYVKNTSTQIEELIRVAEHKSSQTCEECGHPGALKLLDGWWYKTLCTKCEVKR